MKQPPRLADRLLNWFCAPHLREEVLGDLHERYYLRVERVGAAKARFRYWREVLAYVRPSMMKRQPDRYPNPTTMDMLRNYLKIAFRNLVKNKVYSFINIGGLAVGMAVALLIGLWVYDELSFDTYFQHYDRIAQVEQNQLINDNIQTQVEVPIPLANDLRTTYGSNFRQVVLSTKTSRHILTAGETKLIQPGNLMEPNAPELFTLNMLKGTRDGLREPYSIILSESVAKGLFGDADPMNKTVRLDDSLNVKVTGVYEDLPYNSTLRELSFIAPWRLASVLDNDVNNPIWDNNGWIIYVQVADRVVVRQSDMDQVSAKIKTAKSNHFPSTIGQFKPEIFLHPMSRWHLYSEWKNGLNVGGRIQYVWLFSFIGLFVLLLAAINFMNLSTARSEKRAKEVGIRKAVGSVRSQLISQFFSESLLVVTLAFMLALALVMVSLPYFNEIADKQTTILWANPWFWVLGIGFSLVTGLIAGSYPAFYLSSFQPVKVLKGTFKLGRFASLPRRVLVVFQFTISVTLIIGTIIVFRQVQYAKNRPVGYERSGLLSVEMLTPVIHSHFASLRNDLLNTGAVLEAAESSSPTTEIRNEQGNFDWNGKAPNSTVNLSTVGVSHEFGKTIDWQIKDGRDFSREFKSDGLGFIINESARKAMGLQSPVGEKVKWMGYSFTILGVVSDMVMTSPYNPPKPTVFFLAPWWINVVNIRLKPDANLSETLAKIETIFQTYSPNEPVNYKFANDEYARKFSDEERIGKLASVFAILAIFISCLGIFGLASFIAEQRTKEIGVRKVLGASVLNLWSLLSKDFVFLVIIAFGIATPIAWYFLNNWLQKYEYRTTISWWIFVASGAGALIITLLTVSFQSVRAALMNPVKSLRSE